MKAQDRWREVRDPGGEDPEVYLLTREDTRWAFSRRDVMGAAVAAAVAATKAAQAQGCGELRAHSDWIRGLAFARDGGTLISCASDNTVKFWKLPEGAHYRTLAKGASSAVAVSPDGSWLAGAGANVLLWPLPEATSARELISGGSSPLAVVFSPDGRLLVATDRDSKVRIWSAPEGRLLRTLNTDDWANALAIGPDGELLAVGSNSGRVTLWSLPEGRAVNSIQWGRDNVLGVTFSPDGRTLITAAGDVRLWSLPGATLLATLDGHGAVATTPDGSLLVSAAGGAGVALWSLEDRKLIRTLRGHSEDVRELAISGDGRMLASGGYDKTVRLWSLPSGEPLSGCLVDLAATPGTGSGMKYTLDGVTYTLPCGTPLPAGAVCTCNCVPGSYSSGGGGGGGGGGICTCIPVVYRYPN